VARKQGQPAEAIAYLDRYLELRPDAADRDKVEAQKAELKAEQEKAEQEEADREKAEQEKADREEADQLRAQRLETEQRLRAEQLRAERETAARRPPWAAIGLAGGGVALLIVGISMGGAAIATAGQIDAGPYFSGTLHQRGQALDSAAIAFDVLGALALAGGAAWTTVWYLKHRRGQKAPEALRLTPAGLSLAGSF
jgi:hypothetical protein